MIGPKTQRLYRSSRSNEKVDALLGAARDIALGGEGWRASCLCSLPHALARSSPATLDANTGLCHSTARAHWHLAPQSQRSATAGRCGCTVLQAAVTHATDVEACSVLSSRAANLYCIDVTEISNLAVG